MLHIIQIHLVMLMATVIFGDLLSSDNETRLVNADDHQYRGRLQTLVDSDWLPVCFTSLNDKSAKVACKGFGFIDFDSFTIVEVAQIASKTDVYDCNGRENILGRCSTTTKHNVQCDEIELICTAIELDSEYLRINQADELHKGRLELKYNDRWGPVFNENWGLYDSKVACRQLGFIGVIHHDQQLRSGPRVTLPNVDDFKCKSTENVLHDCQHGGWGLPASANSTDVLLTCMPIYKSDGNLSFRLNDSKSHAFQGRLDIKYSTQEKWGSVCNDDVTIHTGHFICNKLGFVQGAANISRDAAFGAGTEDIVLSDLFCNGSEQNLIDCKYSKYVSKACGHTSDLSIQCVPITEESKQNITLKLTGSVHTYEGLVQLSYVDDSGFGTICGKDFEIETAHIICNELGFYQGAYSYSLGESDIGKDSIIMLNKIKCYGNESRLIDCMYEFVDNCTHEHDVSVVCVPITMEREQDIEVKLTDDWRSYKGLVRLSYFDGSGFGTICGHEFSITVANVICREIGFYKGAYSFSLGNVTEEESIIMLNEIQCTGNESKLIDCNFIYVDECTHVDDVSVVCIPIVDESFVTFLFGKFGFYEGVVSIYDGKDFNQICLDSWGMPESDVVCKELGHQGVLYYDTNKPDKHLPEAYKNPVFSFMCNGSESSLFECYLSRNESGGLCIIQDYVVRVECIRFLPDFFNTSANTSELLYNVDFLLIDSEESNNLSSASFGYFVIDSPTSNDTNFLELVDSEPFMYTFYPEQTQFSNLELATSSYLMSLDLSKLSKNETVPFFEESSNTHIYAYAGIFGLNVYSPLGEMLSAKARFTYPNNLTLPFTIDVPKGSTLEPICTYFDPILEIWSSEGLITEEVNGTINCESEHLTSFSIMMKVTIHPQDTSWETILSVMTYLCLGLSISVSIPTYISFMYVRALRLNTRFIIVRNIVLSVCLRDLMFLFTDYVTSMASKPSYLCEVTGALLQYMSTCAFLWMLCASTDIWLKVHFPYFDHTKNIHIYRPLSYIAPVVIVCATIGGFRSGYVDENSCWLSITSRSMFVFYSTAVFLILLTSVQLAMVACKTTKTLKNAVQPTNIETKNPKNSRNIAKSFLPLLAVFGITWILGIFLVIGGTIIFDLLFVIVNGLQGFVIFLSQFLFSKQVRNAWSEHIERVTTRTL